MIQLNAVFFAIVVHKTLHILDLVLCVF